MSDSELIIEDERDIISMSNGNETKIASTGNKILDEVLGTMVSRFETLVDRGFLAPHFLDKMTNDPSEVLKFLQQNRNVVADTLNRRLAPNQRPTPQQLEARGIIPHGYFEYGHVKALKRQHRRRSTAADDLSLMIKMRPKLDDVIKKGVIKKQELETMYVLESSDDENETNDIFNEIYNESGPWEISLLSSLLFLTIQEALQKSCIDTQDEEEIVLQEMENMNKEMKNLRNSLDKYFLSPRPMEDFERDEAMVRKKFHNIQEQLLQISTKQDRIHDKLRILHHVEKSLIELQNNYDQQLGRLRRNEEQILQDLKHQRYLRDRAIKIMHAERSHQNWAMAKLDYTIHIAKDYNILREMNNNELDTDKKEELRNDKEFVNDLEKFLKTLRQVSEHQKQIVRDFEHSIEDLDTQLLQIRHDMSKVRHMTFKKIYDLHKQVQIADTLELGHRRLSVANANEIQRERRHHRIKIQRQLDTLSNQVYHFSVHNHNKKLKEIVDIQVVMSDKKYKSFFSVFIQTLSQTIIDIELTYKQLNSVNNPNNDIISQKTFSQLYGIQNVLNSIETEAYKTLNDKLNVTMKFINTCKNAIITEINEYIINNANNKNNKNQNNNKNNIDNDDEKFDPRMDIVTSNNINNDRKKINTIYKIKTHKIINIFTIIARKLCSNEYMQEEIDRTHEQQVPRLAEIRGRDLFEDILNNKNIFENKIPKNANQTAKLILKNVYAVKMDD